MAEKIFISYRHDDSQEFATQLAAQLTQQFGKENVFIDVESIRPGDELRSTIDMRIGQSHVVLPIVGPGWLDVRDQTGRRRLEDKQDLVHFEIDRAKAHGKHIIPIAISGAKIPKAEELPGSLRYLARKNWVSLNLPLTQDTVTALVAQIRAEDVHEKRTWDVASFRNAIIASKNEPIEDRAVRIIEWGMKHFAHEFGQRTKMATIQLRAKDSDKTLLSLQSDGNLYVWLSNLEALGYVPDMGARENLVKSINETIRPSIDLSKASQSNISIALKNIDEQLLPKLLNTLTFISPKKAGGLFMAIKRLLGLSS